MANAVKSTPVPAPIAMAEARHVQLGTQTGPTPQSELGHRHNLFTSSPEHPPQSPHHNHHHSHHPTTAVASTSSQCNHSKCQQFCQNPFEELDPCMTSMYEQLESRGKDAHSKRNQIESSTHHRHNHRDPQYRSGSIQHNSLQSNSTRPSQPIDESNLKFSNDLKYFSDSDDSISDSEDDVNPDLRGNPKNATTALEHNPGQVIIAKWQHQRPRIDMVACWERGILSLGKPRPLPTGELYQANNPGWGVERSSAMPELFRSGCPDPWQWSVSGKSHDVRLCGRHLDTAFFHPNWSNGTAGVRGTRPINSGVHYWEIHVSSRLFGTSMMFGVATRQAGLHVDSFVNLLGRDSQSWGLSHKGTLWHNGRYRPFCQPFTENVAVTVGMVYDGGRGTLTFFKDGHELGVGFTDLHLVPNHLFPAIASTAAKTEMTLGATRRLFASLQDRCRAVVVDRLVGVHRVGRVLELPLPRVLCRYIWEESQAVLCTL